MSVFQTQRLRVRLLDEDDAPFILELVNDPDWLRHIGDRDVHCLDDARRYIRTGPLDMYQRLDFGLYLVELLATGEPIGMCGLIKRDYLADIDIGFAYLPQFRGKGYALEAAEGTIAYARANLGTTRLAAITSQTNAASERLLGKLGFSFVRNLRAPQQDELLKLYVAELPRPEAEA